MIAAEEKQTILDKILKSDLFASSQVYQDLLRFLVQSSISNTAPKEFTIATEILHKDTNFDPSQDTIVRVYIYNLRKKLEQYYGHQGKNEQVRIELPKGHYHVQFVRNSRQNYKNLLPRYGLFILLLILLCSNIIYIYKYHFQNLSSFDARFFANDAIWGSFISSNMPKQIVLGDHFFFIKDSGVRELRTILRRDDINSLREFEAYKAEKIDRRNLKKLEYPMFPRNSVWPFADILSLFIKTGETYKLNYSSDVTPSDLKNFDIVFVGSFHTLADFDQTFLNSKFSYKVYPNVLSYFDDKSDTLITLPEEGDPLLHHVDYAVARKIPGPNNNIIFLFASFHETGSVGIAKYFTERQSLKELETMFAAKFGHIPPFFEILFKASGFNRTVYSTEVIYIDEISPDAKFW